jgi:hypothetical protein
MDNKIVSFDRRSQQLVVTQIAPDQTEAVVLQVVLEMPLLARREIVEDRDPLNLRICKEPVDKVASDKPGPAGDKHLFDHVAC